MLWKEKGAVGRVDESLLTKLLKRLEGGRILEVNELWGGGGIRRRVAEMWEHLFLIPDFWTGMYCSESGPHCIYNSPPLWYPGLWEPAQDLKGLIMILEVVMLHKKHINEPHGCRCFSRNEWQLWQV